MDISIPSLLSCYQIFQYVCPTIHHVSANSASADNVSHEYKFKSLDTFLTLKCDNAHNWIVLFFMSYSSLFIQLGRSQPMTHWTWLLDGMEWNICLNSWDNSVQSPHNNHTFNIQPLEIQTHCSNAFSAIFCTNNNLLCLHPSYLSKYFKDACIGGWQFTVLIW